MENENIEIKEKFDNLFKEWEKVIQDPKIQLSSRPQDYINNDPYRNIVKLGKNVLPLIIEKLEQGVFFLNQAFIEISGIKLEDILGKEQRFPSEQEKSALLIKWWKSQKQ